MLDLPIEMPPLRKPLNTLNYDMRSIVRMYVERFRDLLDEGVLEFYRPWLGPLPNCPRPIGARWRIYITDHRLRPAMILVPKTKQEWVVMHAYCGHGKDVRDRIEPDDRVDDDLFSSRGYMVQKDAGKFWRTVKPKWFEWKKRIGYVPDSKFVWPLMFVFEEADLTPEAELTPMQLMFYARRWKTRDVIDWVKWGARMWPFLED